MYNRRDFSRVLGVGCVAVALAVRGMPITAAGVEISQKNPTTCNDSFAKANKAVDEIRKANLRASKARRKWARKAIGKRGRTRNGHFGTSRFDALGNSLKKVLRDDQRMITKESKHTKPSSPTARKTYKRLKKHRDQMKRLATDIKNSIKAMQDYIKAREAEVERTHGGKALNKAYIDALYAEIEYLQAVLNLLKQVIVQYGCILKAYADRHGLPPNR